MEEWQKVDDSFERPLHSHSIARLAAVIKTVTIPND